MDQLCLFSSGLEQSDFLVCSGLLNRLWEAISETHGQTHPHDSTFPFVKYKIHPLIPNGSGTIISFVSSPEAAVNGLQTDGVDLISSEELKLSSFDVFDFIGTKVNPSFSIHKAAVTVFHSLLNELTLLRDQCKIGNSSPLIITGHCLGGSIASLFTLWFLETIQPSTSKRPLCITFGSPLLGDRNFQQAISERPTGTYSFLHVVSIKDLVPRLFLSRISQNCLYRPFGTYLLCSESGSACFEESESILELMLGICSSNSPHSQNALEITEYGGILNHLMHQSIFKGASIMNNPGSNLQVGIMLQLTAIGIETQGNGGYLNPLTTNTVEKENNRLTRKKNSFDPNKRLTNRKIDMTYLEWYMKVSMNQGGCYDSYKNRRSASRDQSVSKEEVKKRHKSLTSYWKKMVEEAKKMPQMEGASFCMRWLYSGTNYRRMVEPFDIADYYKKGLTDYVTRGRSQHYVLLEKWLSEDQKRPIRGANERNKACSLTEDSCFWAHVEEAIIACRFLRDGSGDIQRSRDYLDWFENYVMDMIKNFSVSPEIFLAQSSFMQWWDYFSVIKGSFHNSDLANFMKNGYRSYA